MKQNFKKIKDYYVDFKMLTWVEKLSICWNFLKRGNFLIDRRNTPLMKWSTSWAGYTTESSIMLCPMIAIYQYFKIILSDDRYLIFCFFLYNFFEQFKKAKESKWTLSNRLLVSCITWWAMCQLSTCFQAKSFCWQWADMCKHMPMF